MTLATFRRSVYGRHQFHFNVCGRRHLGGVLAAGTGLGTAVLDGHLGLDHDALVTALLGDGGQARLACGLRMRRRPSCGSGVAGVGAVPGIALGDHRLVWQNWRWRRGDAVGVLQGLQLGLGA